MSTLTLDAEALYADLLQAVRAQLQQKPQTYLVGIYSGGVWLAERLYRDLNLKNPLGELSSALHRDDFNRRGLAAISHPTTLPFEVQDAHIILIDDVLYTGRTIRAALNELFDYGRPQQVSLVVLVDRGGRELPIEAEFAAAKVRLPDEKTLALACNDDGTFAFEIQSTAQGDAS
ncbi:Bifunctional protein pyrR [Saezia sanguinis]|uniref:Bifunctional protein pyrR n=1 Tax=Saezia sanguinis TaxID=1965230 RepID=A0A433SAC2_9BURK|nr:bifunctional pyr operon transcriptional regulator/uracil phosphoribosyltransferase PyrR [Saezia sanguinis]RUS65681.1 Bifunctional protein pyrR [Saezia sanguinis]